LGELEVHPFSYPMVKKTVGKNMKYFINNFSFDREIKIVIRKEDT